MADWFDQEHERQLTQQRATLDSARLVATFVAATAAGLAGVALQQASAAGLRPGYVGLISLIALAATSLLAVWILVSDGLEGPKDPAAVIADDALTPVARIKELRNRTILAVTYNRQWLQRVKSLTRWQIVSGVISWGASILWLLTQA